MGSKKWMIIGGLWGLVSAIGFLIQLTKPINQINRSFGIIFFPGSIAARIILGPSLVLVIIFPIVSIIIGVLIGYLIGKFFVGR